MGHNQGNNNESHGNHDNHENHGNRDIRKKTTCHTETCEKIAVKVPVEISAHANIRDITLNCADKHVVREHERNSVKLEIVQEMFAKIPIDFIAEVEVKNEEVDFDTHACKP
jgi:hypothetical protein